MMRLAFRLPMPTSTNRIHMPDGRGGICVTPEARAYARAVAMHPDTPRVPIFGPYRVWIEAFFGPKGGDLGNVEKLLSDALNLRAWMDDRHALGIYLERRTAVGPPYVALEVEGERQATKAELEAALLARAQTDARKRAGRTKARLARLATPNARGKR